MKHDHAAAEVQKSNQELHAFYKLGQESLRRYPGQVTASFFLSKEAQRRGLRRQTVSDARRFAQRYTKKELAELCRQCLECRCPMGPAKLALLLPVPKTDRVQFQKEALLYGWSANQIRTEIAARFGKHSSGGRKPKPPNTPSEAYQQIADLCGKWQRWLEVTAPSMANPKHGGYPLRSVLDEMPKGVRDQIGNVHTAIQKLAQLAARHGKLGGGGRKPKKSHTPSRANLQRGLSPDPNMS